MRRNGPRHKPNLMEPQGDVAEVVSCRLLAWDGRLEDRHGPQIIDSGRAALG